MKSVLFTRGFNKINCKDGVIQTGTLKNENVMFVNDRLISDIKYINMSIKYEYVLITTNSNTVYLVNVSTGNIVDKIKNPTDEILIEIQLKEIERSNSFTDAVSKVMALSKINKFNLVYEKPKEELKANINTDIPVILDVFLNGYAYRKGNKEYLKLNKLYIIESRKKETNKKIYFCKPYSNENNKNKYTVIILQDNRLIEWMTETKEVLEHKIINKLPYEKILFD